MPGLGRNVSYQSYTWVRRCALASYQSYTEEHQTKLIAGLSTVYFGCNDVDDDDSDVVVAAHVPVVMMMIRMMKTMMLIKMMTNGTGILIYV